jgi:hypothetical protein
MLCPQTLASSGTNDCLVLPGLGIDPSAEEATCSLDAILDAEIRDGSRPAAKRHMRRQR